ncbi:zinc finger protein 835-like [Centroberyx affinis]|uniref:zinc finger protein 835-like n=1 Tax=Centroberyx affinis TaxID=166261 RepID=UPI003A5B9893
MSKAEILRGIVTERLAAAAQEILAVVERTVAGYEEEASGFKQEIDRQRRQLDVLLQPRVKLEREGVEDSGTPGLLCGDEEEEGEDEEDESPERPAPSPSQRRVDLKDLDYQTPSRLFSPRGQSEKRKPGGPRIRGTQHYLNLRVCMLEDSQTDVLSNNVFKKCPVQEVKCPRGLREADFLDLLRSSFPQLAGGNKPFDLFTADRSRKLQPLKLKTLTPEEIHRSIRSSGAGKSALYIRRKTGQESQVSQEELHPLQRKDEATKDSPSTSAMMTSDQTKPQTSSRNNPIQRVESNGADLLASNSASQPQQMETEEADDGGECGVPEQTDDFLAISSPCSAAESEQDASGEDEKRDDGDEASERDDDWKPDKRDEDLKESEPGPQSPKTMRKRQAKRSGVEAKRRELIRSSSKTVIENSDLILPCRVCGALHRSTGILMKHAWSHVDDPVCLCGVCGERSDSAEVLRVHLQSHQKTHDCPVCGKSYLRVDGLNEHVAAHTGGKTHECDVCHKTFALKSSVRTHQKSHVVGKPHKCDICHKPFALKEQVKAHRRIHVSEKSFRCSVCGKSLCDLRSLSRHKLTHTGERRYSCSVCGKRFKLPGTLKAHERIHTNRDREYLCDVCCKMFLTSKQLQIHMRTHTKERPYHCSECGKGFSTKGPLTVHMRIHTGETPYRCTECGWSFKRKTHLDNHLRVHSGQKPFVCGVCGKACSRPEHLTVHMRTHSGERPYQCAVCDKAFTQSHCLKAHMKSHQMGETAT